MSKKNNEIKVLSESVLLEEKGLPGLNSMIVLIVSFLLCAFIVWSLVMEIEDTVRVSGLVMEDPLIKGQYSVIALISPNEIGGIKEGHKASVSMMDFNKIKPMSGVINALDDAPQLSDDGSWLYTATIQLKDSSEWTQLQNSDLLLGMELAIDIVVKKRTFFEYVLGPIFNRE